jgi:predicted enzyme related to lactoylglutathione lyase
VSERSGYNSGEFCWVDLGVPDPEAAAEFYGDLIGWERERYEPDPEGYWYLRHNGKLVAGLEGFRSEGQVPAWVGFVRVDDAAQSADKVRAAGGAIITGPLEVPGGAGSLAVCQDTEGAVFALWQPGELNGAELVNEIGCWTWNNLMSRDLDKAKDFYGEVFGWEATQSEEQPLGILNWQLDGQRWPEGLGGLMKIDSDMPADTPPHWQVYFAVESADAAVEQTKGAGGQLLFGPIDIPVARMAVLMDPQGAAFAILEPKYPEKR